MPIPDHIIGLVEQGDIDQAVSSAINSFPGLGVQYHRDIWKRISQKSDGLEHWINFSLKMSKHTSCNTMDHDALLQLPATPYIKKIFSKFKTPEDSSSFLIQLYKSYGADLNILIKAWQLLTDPKLYLSMIDQLIASKLITDDKLFVLSQNIPYRIVQLLNRAQPANGNSLKDAIEETYALFTSTAPISPVAAQRFHDEIWKNILSQTDTRLNWIKYAVFMKQNFSNTSDTKIFDTLQTSNLIGYLNESRDNQLLIDLYTHGMTLPLDDLIKYLNNHQDIQWLLDLYHHQLIQPFEFLESIYSSTLDRGLFFKFIDHFIEKKMITPQQFSTVAKNALAQYDIIMYDQLKIASLKYAQYELVLDDHLNRIYMTVSPLSRNEKVKLHDIMSQFKNGSDCIKYTNEIDYLSTTYALASIKSSKIESYHFLPTVLRPKEFKAYLEYIAKQSPPIKEYFLLYGGHWESGMIEIDEKGHLHFLILDSLGEDLKDFICDLDLERVFPELEITVYFTNQTRQYADPVCNIFAIDDVRHLHTIEQDTSGQRSVFSQLNDRIIAHETLHENITVNTCRLPVSLMRTMQSRRLLSEFTNEEQTIVNKQGVNFSVSSKQHFTRNEKDEPLHNKRINHKLTKIAERLDRYISDSLSYPNGYERMVQAAREHTFSGFVERTEASMHKTHGVFLRK